MFRSQKVANRLEEFDDELHSFLCQHVRRYTIQDIHALHEKRRIVRGAFVLLVGKILMKFK